ncbi:ABC-F family ATP-binding cassette domain-containing protein [Xenorhabdus stockiae]|uniref:ABC-F family ATP-binding cassette domain-containing protein n=1 Tax=Xenorhabdus stockiae TaxID=351614 RepID=UPI004063D999
MINLKNIMLQHGSKVLLNKANLKINQGEKVGLVGRNGVGKSTLFALISGRMNEENGEVDLPKYCRITQVDQNMPESTENATDFVIAGDTELMAARVRLIQATEQDDGMAMAQAYCDLSDAGDYDAAPRAQSILMGLGFRPEEMNTPVNQFSGGWRMRLQLARTLMCPSDLMLLDEPTNHLDLDALSWLESWLSIHTGTIIVISHDRDFLDNITNVTVHLEHNQLIRYNGNYSLFETLRAQQLELQHAAYTKQQEQVSHLQKYINRFRYKATKARQAQSRIKALERMEKVSAVIADSEFTLLFSEPASLPNPMLVLRDLDFGYSPHAEAEDQQSVLILSGINRTILAGQRIGILGANGQGKSTFIKTIAGTIPPLSGSVTEGRGLSIGYFAQHELDVLQPEDSPLQHMIRLSMTHIASSREQELRNYLGTFNFSGNMITQPVDTMSGGEKARLVLAMIVWKKPNLLLLDEPTNHLDLITREALSLALNQYDGTVLLVSHDRALLRSVCNEFWLVGNGDVRDFEGDLEDYKHYLLNES